MPYCWINAYHRLCTALMIFWSYAPNGLEATLNAAIPLRNAPDAVSFDLTVAISRPEEPGTLAGRGGTGACISGCEGCFGAIATFVSSATRNPSDAIFF